MRFSFSTPWCACGKPMSVGCENDVPSDFFDALTPYEAYRCHILQMNYERNITLPCKQCIDGNKLTVQCERYDISVECENMHEYNFTTTACDSIHLNCDEVNDSEILLLKKIANDKNISFDEFANKYKSSVIDIIVSDGWNWLFRLFVTSDYVHLHSNNKIYDLSNGSVLGWSSWRGTFKFVPVNRVTFNGKSYEF